MDKNPPKIFFMLWNRSQENIDFNILIETVK